MPVPGEKIYIPLEADTEAGLGLIFSTSAMSIIDCDVESFCKRAKEWGIVLYRMGSNNSETHVGLIIRVAMLYCVIENASKLA